MGPRVWRACCGVHGEVASPLRAVPSAARLLACRSLCLHQLSWVRRCVSGMMNLTSHVGRLLWQALVDGVARKVIAAADRVDVVEKEFTKRNPGRFKRVLNTLTLQRPQVRCTPWWCWCTCVLWIACRHVQQLSTRRDARVPASTTPRNPHVVCVRVYAARAHLTLPRAVGRLRTTARQLCLTGIARRCCSTHSNLWPT